MRRRLTRIATCLAVILCVAGVRPPARATTIDPLIWEQLVLDAGFVGIVECETAGGIVAGYRVVESWKGVPVGTRFKMRMAINYWGPQFPVTLVGERYLVTAFSADAPTRIMSYTSGSPVPLWWRDIPAEYNLPLWQGRVRLPLRAGERPLGELGSEHADVASFKKAVDGADPLVRVEVQLYVDGRFVAHSTASLPRPDVVAAGRAEDERCGYSFALPPLPAGEHEARVYALHSVRFRVGPHTLKQLGNPLRFTTGDDGRVMTPAR